MIRVCIWLVGASMVLLPGLATARYQSHYIPGLFSLADYFVPRKRGFTYEQYNFYYYADDYYDKDGDKNADIPISATEAVQIKPGIENGAIVPTIRWVSPLKAIGARYAVSASWVLGRPAGSGTMNALYNETYNLLTSGSSDEDTTNYGLGDLYVSPIALGWNFRNSKITWSYGFYAPVGQYDATDLNNSGLGFWTNQMQLGGAYYLNNKNYVKKHSTTFMGNLTYEYNNPQRDTSVTPGSYLTLDWGIGQYVTSNIELAMVGYFQKQITSDKLPSDSQVPNQRSEAQAVGCEVTGWWGRQWKFTGRLLYEYEAKARQAGYLGTFNFSYRPR